MKYLQVAIKTFFVIFLLGAFLLPGKYSFWPEFHQSASAICVAIISSIALIFYKRIAINHFSIILFFFCIAIVFDLFLERNYFFAFNFYGLLYLLAAIFLSIYCINNEDDSLYYIFSVSLIFISLVSFLLQIYQITGWWVDYQLIINYLDENDNRAYANIGQPNLLGTLYVVSIIVSLVNFSQKKINGKILSLLIFIFSLGVYLTASRVAMLSLFLVSIFLLGQEKFRANPISVALPSALIIIFFSKFSIPFLFSLEERSLISSNFSNGRFEIWRMALSQVGKNLSTGYGFNRFGLASFYNLDTFPYLENTFVTQSHNLFIDLFIWFGIPIGIILSVAIFIFIFIFVKENFSFKDRNFLYIASFPVLIHAIFEYPLYYQNFLSIFAIIIGLSKKNKVFYINPNLIRILTLIFWSFSLQAFYEMKTLEVSLLEQKLYANRIYKSKNQEPRYIMYADLIKEHIELMAFREDADINEDVIKRMENFSSYYIVPKYIYFITNFYKEKNNYEMFELWRKRGRIFLPKEYSNYYNNLKFNQ